MQQEAPIHVLVVEDDMVSRDVACQILSHFGYHVTPVDSGIAALLHVRDSGCDVVLMDYRMLDMDGLETTRRLRAGEAGPNGLSVPIIALTAQAFVADCEACLAAGMNDFLTKPVAADSLIAAIERWGGRRTGKTASDELKHATARPAGQQASGPAIFDPTVIAALPMVADGTQPSYAQLVLALYLKSVPPLLTQIRQAAHNGNTQSAQHAAHTLKSSSAAVGAMALAQFAADAEMHLRSGNQGMSHLPDRFEMEFERLRARLASACDPLSEGAVPPC